jgi:cobalt-zinc-cadmium efflux system protein
MAHDHHHNHDHAHDHHPHLGHPGVSAADQDKGTQLAWAAYLTAAIMVVEAVGGWWTHSLALMSDAGHVFSDVASLALAYVALRLALRPPTDRHTYGLHRGEVFAALTNAIALLVISGLIFWEAYRRLSSPPEIKSGVMLALAVVGLAINLLVMFRLQPHSHGDLNLRSAYLHVLGDLLATVGVIVAALIMLLTPWSWRYLADPILSGLIGLLILGSALRVGHEALHILLEGVPFGLTLDEIVLALGDIPEITSIHHLHAWSICSNIRAVSLHVVANYENEAQRMRLRHAVEALLLERFGFSQTTVETECDEVCPVDVMLYPVRHIEGAEDGHGH